MAALGTVGISNKGNYNPTITYKKGNFVLHNDSTWLVLANEVTGVAPVDDGLNWKYLAKGASMLTDTEGLLGSAGASVSNQELTDEIADRVGTKLLPIANLKNNGTTAVSGEYALDANYGKTLTDNINMANTNIEKLSNRQMIFVGDSYGESPALGSDWITFTNNYIDKSNTYRAHISGGSFGGPVKLLTALQTLESTITNKNLVTDIIVGCGYNEIDYVSAIETGMIAFSTYVKSTYPNALVSIFLISLTNNASKQDTLMTNVLEKYKRTLMITNNMAFVDGSQYIFHRYDYLGVDGIHPIEAGSAEIAKGIGGYILTKNFTYSSQNFITSNVTHSGINTDLDFSLIETDCGETINVISFGGTFTCASQVLNTFNEIGTISPVYIRGRSGSFAGATISVNIYVASGWKSSPACIIVQNGKIKLSVYSLEAATSVWIPQLNFVLNKSYC